jgi:DNA primase
MGLFPQSFIDDLRLHADIVQVVQDRVSLRRSGATYKGLCPFHAEKTPSFHVNPDKGFFHCFGCGVGGDVFKFVELHDKLAFPEAVRQLAGRFGVPVPELEDRQDAAADREREALLKLHEVAAAWFQQQLATPAGARARRQLEARGLAPRTVETLGIGFAPAARGALTAHLAGLGFQASLVARSGLVVPREDGTTIDRFRNRLMIPIHRESGPVVAFGGRAMEEGQQPKYLNSPETPIYVKGRTLYGLHATKDAIRRLGYAVLVEGYFDFAQAIQAGVAPVVASSGTALTPAQARLLRRYTGKVILSFDPDAAGQGAAVRSSELLVAEGFQVNVAVLPAGQDPDNVIRSEGGQAYQEKLRSSRPYLEYLLDREAEAHDLAASDGRHAFLVQMLGVAARIPDAAARDQFADRLAHKARITEEVVRAEIRRAAVRRTGAEEAARLPVLLGQITAAEKGLLWAVINETPAAQTALAELDPADLTGLAAGALLQEARALEACETQALPDTLRGRLSKGEADLLGEIARQPGRPAPPAECVRALKRRRFERERAELQREIDRLQELGAARHDGEIDALWAKKKDLLQRIEALGA